jgi:uncharacterized membrane protein YuzA (DUF378 family)
MKALFTICKILIIVGALNWGLFGLFHLDLVAALFGKIPMLAKLVYILVGAAGIVEIFTFKKPQE